MDVANEVIFPSITSRDLRSQAGSRCADAGRTDFDRTDSVLDRLSAQLRAAAAPAWRSAAARRAARARGWILSLAGRERLPRPAAQRASRVRPDADAKWRCRTDRAGRGVASRNR